MRYQRISSEDEEKDIVMEEMINGTILGGCLSRFRSPATKKANYHSDNNGVESSNNNGEDVFLQWGHRKRSRCSREVVVSPQRRSLAHQNSYHISTNGTMHLSSLPSSNNAGGKAPNYKHSSRRDFEKQSSGGGGGGEAKSSATQSGAANRIVQSRSKGAVKKTTPLSPGATTTTTRVGTINGGSTLVHQHSHLEAMPIASKNAINDANDGVEVHEWPRIYVALSRKEKEEDFMAMKGSKLPHRPKKRPKAIDRMLQYCYPGMWLSELTRGRYEVREKKSTKKQRKRGLKGMDSIESGSE